mmetsp:Transcript_9235/g.20520  ORF Transcript_9235/g.20520 Transcript_9235/m.20520 type:complete len:206 (-) Transcript_9235:355-972(-)
MTCLLVGRQAAVSVGIRDHAHLLGQSHILGLHCSSGVWLRGLGKAGAKERAGPRVDPSCTSAHVAVLHPAAAEILIRLGLDHSYGLLLGCNLDRLNCVFRRQLDLKAVLLDESPLVCIPVSWPDVASLYRRLPPCGLDCWLIVTPHHRLSIRPQLLAAASQALHLLHGLINLAAELRTATALGRLHSAPKVACSPEELQRRGPET